MKIVEPKFYLNKLLKPDLEGHYKVYLRFSIGRNNHRFKSQLINMYLHDEKQLEDYKELIDLETTYLNTLINYSNGEYPFNFYSADIYRLHSDLFYLFTTNDEIGLTKIDIEDLFEEGTYQENEFNEISGKLIYEEPSRIENFLYRDMLIKFLHDKAKLEIEYLNLIVKDDIVSNKLPLETSFLTIESTKDYIQTCNDLISFSKNEDINIYKWVFKNYGLIFKEKYGLTSFNILNEFVINICHDIFMTKNIYDQINMLKN